MIDKTNLFNEIDTYVGLERRSKVLDLFHYLSKNGFMEAPASSQHSHHNAYTGGLVDHSIGVTENLFTVREAFDNAVPIESCFIVGMFHDASKCCDGFGRACYLPNILKSGDISESKPYEKNKDIIQLSDAYRAALIVNKFVPLTEDEIQAIAHHDYLWVPEGKLLAVNRVAPLTLMLHFADMWAGILEENQDSMLNTQAKRNLKLFCE